MNDEQRTLDGSEGEGEEDNYDDYNDDEIGEDGKPSRKRRSKHDNSQRNYICGCGKSYLSYAALYTHAKTKHNGEFPENTTTLSKKKQGRPKKEDSNGHRNYSLIQKRQ